MNQPSYLRNATFPNLSLNAVHHWPALLSNSEFYTPRGQTYQKLQEVVLEIANGTGLFPQSKTDKAWAAAVAAIAHLRMAAVFLEEMEAIPHPTGTDWMCPTMAQSHIAPREPTDWQTQLDQDLSTRPRLPTDYMAVTRASGEIGRMGMNATTVERIHRQEYWGVGPSPMTTIISPVSWQVARELTGPGIIPRSDTPTRQSDEENQPNHGNQAEPRVLQPRPILAQGFQSGNQAEHGNQTEPEESTTIYQWIEQEINSLLNSPSSDGIDSETDDH